MDTSIRGIVPVMLTPFKDTGDIDWEGLEALIHWYLDHGAEALFRFASHQKWRLYRSLNAVIWLDLR